jgi:ferric-dicitrate binding protein FerR (iron transport regulator)
MKGHNLKGIPSLVIVILAALASASAQDMDRSNTIGVVTLFEGTAELSSFVSGERFTIDEGSEIRPGYRIVTGAATILDIRLKDGTRRCLGESTSLSVYYLRQTRKDPPTTLRMDYGKIRIIQKQHYRDKNLELTTPTSQLSVVSADFSVIAAEEETLVLVSRGRVGMASSDPAVREAFIGTDGEEILIKKEEPPSPAIVVPPKRHGAWLRQYQVVDRNRRIARANRELEIIDWIMRRRTHD